MSCLCYRGVNLYIENISLHQIAEKFGTPVYVYSQNAIISNWQAFTDAFSKIKYHRICYAVKANSNLAILNTLAKLDAGFDIVSLGELERVIKAGGLPEKIIFSGVGKSESEMTEAIRKNIYCFNVESEAELERLNAIAAKLKRIINISLRINPNIDPNTHAYISTGLKENKFGIEISQIIPICRRLPFFTSLHLIGIACHIGSQIVKINPFIRAIDRLLDIYQQLLDMNIQIRHLNLGGGLGIIYQDETPPSITEYVQALCNKIGNLPLEIIIEPGRSLIGNAGILLTRVEYIKHTSQKNFAIVDAGMNDLLRPALYQAWQNILPVTKKENGERLYDIAGPVCESADFLGKNRHLALQSGDLLAIDGAGAYGFSMSSNYNSRCRPAEVLVNNDKTMLIRRRETINDLFLLEPLA